VAKIEAVLFDFGGVFTASPFHTGRRFADANGLDFDRMFAALFGDYHSDTDHPWHQVERGELAVADAFAQIKAMAIADGVGFDIQALMSAVSDDIDRTIVVDKVRALRAAGIRTGIITNNIREYSDRWRQMIPVDELFDDVIDSSAVGVRKPNPEIFRLALRRLDVGQPQAAVFLDDFAPYVEAAKALGLHGVLVDEDPGPALHALDRIVAGQFTRNDQA
jgi:epoxide hydrolase-like predicted phosphatase